MDPSCFHSRRATQIRTFVGFHKISRTNGVNSDDGSEMVHPEQCLEEVEESRRTGGSGLDSLFVEADETVQLLHHLMDNDGVSTDCEFRDRQSKTYEL